MNIHFEKAFDKVFNNPASCQWRQGYSDAIEGKRCVSNNKHYVEGYNKAYKKEKRHEQ